MMILTTTDTGLLGSNIKFDYALNRDNCDLHDYKSVLSIIKEVNPSGIIHFAGRLQPASQGSYRNNHGILDNNLRIDLNIIRAAVECKIQNVLCISSISAYGEISDLPYKEEDIFKGDSNRKYYGYSTSKRLTIDLNRSVRLDTGWNYKTILLDLSHVNNSYEQIKLKPVDGVLGSDLLLKYSAVIDYDKKILKLKFPKKK